AAAPAQVRVRAPYSALPIATTANGAANCGPWPGTAGWSRSVTQQVRYQWGSDYQVANLSMTDLLTPGTPNDLGVSSASYGPFPTDASGRFPDTYFVCSTACPANTGSSLVQQNYWYSGINLRNSD